MFENHAELLAKLKKHVRELQQKEVVVRAQLETTLKNLQKFGVKYQAKLVHNVRQFKTKINSIKSQNYIKAVVDAECKLLKQVEEKALALAAAAKKLKTEHAKKFGAAKRAAKSGNGKKTSANGKRKR